MRRAWWAASLLTLALAASVTVPRGETQAQGELPAADIAIINARVWTGEKDQPWAEAVAIAGDRIIAVGSSAQISGYIRPNNRTRVLNLRGRLVVPGFIDNHVHFTSAGRLLLGLNLLDVNDAEQFRRRVAEGAARLTKGAWLVGGDWGAYAQWAVGSTGKPGAEKEKPFEPTKELIDPVTSDHPALISRFDQQLFLANSLALKAAGITADTPNPEGGEIVRDAKGQPTGLLRGASAARLVRRAMPAPSYEQRRAEALRALEEARKFGVTTMHDNTANFEQLELLRDLQRSGHLTARIWARMPLSDWEKVRDYVEKNKVPAVDGGWGDDWIRLGGLKAWVDGIMGNSSALFFEPYNHDPANSGRLRDVMFPEGNLERLIRGADRAGFTVTVHAIGDKANRILLDTFDRVFADHGMRDRRFRVVHAQVVHPDDFARFGKLQLVAEVQPFHTIDDMRWMEERIAARARTSYAFRTLQQSGAVMSFGTDWPGTNASYYPINPIYGIYAAVTRQTLEGQPAGGWFPAERIKLEDALRYYTANNAWSTFEENSKGTIKAGKLADIAVLDRDIFALVHPEPAEGGRRAALDSALRRPKEFADARVLYTIVGGKVVYEAPPR